MKINECSGVNVVGEGIKRYDYSYEAKDLSTSNSLHHITLPHTYPVIPSIKFRYEPNAVSKNHNRQPNIIPIDKAHHIVSGYASLLLRWRSIWRIVDGVSASLSTVTTIRLLWLLKLNTILLAIVSLVGVVSLAGVLIVDWLLAIRWRWILVLVIVAGV